jgi:hypothetical protein
MTRSVDMISVPSTGATEEHVTPVLGQTVHRMRDSQPAINQPRQAGNPDNGSGNV